MSHNSLRMCLETLLMQPGIVVENVMVCIQFNGSQNKLEFFRWRLMKSFPNPWHWLIYSGLQERKRPVVQPIWVITSRNKVPLRPRINFLLEHYEKALNKIWERHPTKVKTICSFWWMLFLWLGSSDCHRRRSDLISGFSLYTGIAERNLSKGRNHRWNTNVESQL